MLFSSLLKLGVATTSAAVMYAFQKEFNNYHATIVSNRTAFAATIEPSSIKWDDNWDKRAHEKPTATRHIILVRHGQYNLKGATAQDKYLTDLGREQATLTGKRLKALGLDKKISVVVESTMIRAQETNKLICQELGFNAKLVDFESSNLLREGAPIEPEPPASHWVPDPQDFFVDGSRIETAFRQYIHRANASQEKDSVELIVCHANVIRYFVCRALQLPPEAWLRISIRHASITHLSIRPNGRVSLKALGDAGHLPFDKLTFE